MPILKVGSTGNVKFPFRGDSIAQLLKKFSDANKDLTGLNQERNSGALDYLRGITQSRLQNKDQVTNALSSNANRGTALSSNYAKQRAALAQSYNNDLSEQQIDRNSFLNTDRLQRAGVANDYNDILRQLAAEQTGYDPSLNDENDALQKQVFDANRTELADAQSDIKSQTDATRRALMEQLLGIKGEANADLSRLGHGNVDLASNFSDYETLYNQLLGGEQSSGLQTIRDLLNNENSIFKNRKSLIPQIEEEPYEDYGAGGGFAPFAPYGYAGGMGGWEDYGSGNFVPGGGPTRDALTQEAIDALNQLPKDILQDIFGQAPGGDDLSDFERAGYNQRAFVSNFDSLLKGTAGEGTDDGSSATDPHGDPESIVSMMDNLNPAKRRLTDTERLLLGDRSFNSNFSMPTFGAPSSSRRKRNRSDDDDDGSSNRKKSSSNKSKAAKKKRAEQKKKKRATNKKLKKYGKNRQSDDNNTSRGIVDKVLGKPRKRRRPGNTKSAAAADREYEKRDEKKKKKRKVKKSKKSRRDGGEKKRKKVKRKGSKGRKKKKKKKKFKGKRRGPG